MKFVILIGPSGVGKTTVVNRILSDRVNFCYNTTYTTRERRSDEIDGLSFNFISKKAFQDMIDNSEFIEYDAHYNNYYGTKKGDIEERLKTKNLIALYNPDGAIRMKELFPNAITIFIAGDRDKLKDRLIKRNTENKEDLEEKIRTMDYEYSFKDKFDYLIVDDNLDSIVETILSIVDQS